MRAHLSAHGVEAGEAHMNYGPEGDGPSLYVSDPEGNVVELKGPAAVWPRSEVVRCRLDTAPRYV